MRATPANFGGPGSNCGNSPPENISRLSITEHWWDTRRVTLVLSGALDLAGARRLETAADQAFARTADLKLDLSAVTFIDSSGVRVLIRMAQSWVPIRGRLQIVRPTAEGPRILFTRLGVDARVPWSVDEG